MYLNTHMVLSKPGRAFWTMRNAVFILWAFTVFGGGRRMLSHTGHRMFYGKPEHTI